MVIVNNILIMIKKDTIEILQAYTRSRYIRIRKFVKKLLSAASSLRPSQKGMLYTSSAKQNLE